MPNLADLIAYGKSGVVNCLTLMKRSPKKLHKVFVLSEPFHGPIVYCLLQDQIPPIRPHEY